MMLTRAPGSKRASGLADVFAALLLGSGALLVVQALTGVRGIADLGLLAGFGILGAAMSQGISLLWGRRARWPGTRVAVIGGAALVERLRGDLDGRSREFEIVGRIAVPGDDDPSTPVLASLDRLHQAVVEHDIRLLILSPRAPRLMVFDELASRCLDLPVKLVELPSFYEAVLGYVPLSEMNVVWFQHLVDPYAQFPHPRVKRAIDLVGATLLAVPALPVCAALVLLVRRDGGPGIFRQRRIGEGGRPFTLYKLRTMRASTSTDAQWAAVDDPRVTPVGRVLRYTHLDELPQLFNVLRGEMSLVGPRPEQPAVVQRLERDVPFYQRRHMVRPGITGWAQIRCGYARTDSGSVWKHSHDLYYLKHRSISIDLRILAVTVRLAVLGAIRKTEVIARTTAYGDTTPPPSVAEQDPALVVVKPPVARS
jgi:exopolysaccharide biosynthesis polyprenyl glycosylphosphotransferase